MIVDELYENRRIIRQKYRYNSVENCVHENSLEKIQQFILDDIRYFSI